MWRKSSLSLGLLRLRFTASEGLLGTLQCGGNKQSAGKTNTREMSNNANRAAASSEVTSNTGRGGSCISVGSDMSEKMANLEINWDRLSLLDLGCRNQSVTMATIIYTLKSQLFLKFLVPDAQVSPPHCTRSSVFRMMCWAEPLG